MLIFIISLSFFWSSCSNNSSTNNGKKEKEVDTEQEKSPITINDLIGNWKIAVNVQGQWYHILGCDSYGLNITDITGGKGIASLSMSDRMGLSINFSLIAKNFTITKDGHFQIKCKDQNTNAEYLFEGDYFESFEDWSGPIIKVTRNDFSSNITSEAMTEEEIFGIMLFMEKNEGNEPKYIDEYNCDTGFEEDMVSEIIPDGGLTPETMTTERMFNLITAYEEKHHPVDEIETVNAQLYDNHWLIINDFQDGDYTDMTLYSIDLNGKLLEKKNISGVFDWLDGRKKYLVTDENKIFCKPGEWKFNESKEMMELKTKDTYIWLDKSGKIQISN